MCFLLSKEKYDQLMREWEAQGCTLRINCPSKDDEVNAWIEAVIKRLWGIQ